MTRLRYTTLENGTLVSKTPVTYNDTTYNVTIYPTENTWFILVDGKVVFNGSAENVPALKKAVRSAFLTAGVFLGSETRMRKLSTLDVAAKTI